MVDLAGSDWARIGLMYVASLVFIAAMYNLGLLFSCLTGRSAISLVFGLFLWVIFVVVIPNGSIYLATQIQPLESEERKDGQIASLRDQLHNKLRQLELPDGGAQSDDDGAFGHWYHRLCDRPCLERYQKQYAFGVPLAIEYADKFWEVEHSYLSSLCGQRGLARTLSRISPIALYENAMSTLADTDISSFQYFVDHVRIYRTRVIEYIRSRTDNFSSSSLFTPCTEEEMMEYGKLISRAYHVENDDRDKAWQDLKKWFEDKVSEPPSLDLQDFPQFTYHRAAILSFRRAIADLTLLLVINVVFFALAFVVFLRYDVRSV
jgi:ABC-type transport system involved in multi-copper enzyme maturation permease subunit